jgi:dipeptidase E
MLVSNGQTAPNQWPPGAGTPTERRRCRPVSHNGRMRLLLTSSGVTNRSIENALAELLGKPISESNALFVPTAIYPFRGGQYYAWRAVSGSQSNQLVGLGWNSVGLLELSVLPSIDSEAWVPTVEEADALLFWGGDPFFLTSWIRKSGLADLLPTLEAVVYVGVSAGSMAATATFAETYTEPPSGSADTVAAERVVFQTPTGPIERLIISGHGAGLVDFAVIPHLDAEGHEDASLANAEIWASHISTPTYAIDDQTALKVVDGEVEVISEGHWQLFNR